MAEKDNALRTLEASKNLPSPNVQQLNELPTLYVNSIEPSFSAFDAKFILGESLGVEDGEIKVHRHLKLVMSLEHAKAFAIILSNGIAQFEEITGQEIPKFDLSRAAEAGE